MAAMLHQIMRKMTKIKDSILMKVHVSYQDHLVEIAEMLIH